MERAREQEGDLVTNATRENARMVVDQLKSSQPTLASLVQAGKLKVVAAHYDLDSGQVMLLE